MLIVCTTQGCISDNEPKGPSLKVGDPLPVFSVEMNDGSVVSNETLRGKVALIIFFNTDCGDCRKEFPVVQKIWDTYKDSSMVRIVPIAREETEEEISQYWEKEGFTMPYSPQPNRDVYSLFAQSVIPRIYIASPDGIITAAFGDQDMPDYHSLVEAINAADTTEEPQVIPGTENF